jgi:hypothetical protein
MWEQPGDVIDGVTKISGHAREQPIDFDTRVLRAIGFDLKDPLHQLFSTPAPRGPRTAAICPESVAFHQNVSMGASLGNRVVNRLVTVRALDRDSEPVCGRNRILSDPIEVLLTDNKRGW